MESNNISGIYSIMCIENDRIYIGLSKNINHRRHEHFQQLRRGKHYNIFLQRAFNKYGEENFKFEILEFCNSDILSEREKYWIFQLNALNIERGFNMNPGGSDTSSTKQRKGVVLYDKEGRFIESFLNAAMCDRFLKIKRKNGNNGATLFTLGSPTRTIKGYYVREWDKESPYPNTLDIDYINYLKRENKRRASKLGQLGSKLKTDFEPGLFSTEQIKLMIKGELSSDNLQSHGIDLNVMSIKKLSGIGRVCVKGRTKVSKYDELELVSYRDEEGRECLVWKLDPGTYDITFKQGCCVPPYAMLLIRQRSSLLRNGAIIHSSIFDAGFSTMNIGTIMIVNLPIIIEDGARIANIYGHKCHSVENLYEGQFQGDKQRG